MPKTILGKLSPGTAVALLKVGGGSTTQAAPSSDEIVAEVVPGLAGNFEGLVTSPTELIFRVEASRKWFSVEELAALERMVHRILAKKKRPALRAI